MKIKIIVTALIFTLLIAGKSYGIQGNFIIGNILSEKLMAEVDPNLAWDNSDPNNTQKGYTFSQPDHSFSEYELIVYNPSTVTDLTCKVFAVEAGLGDDCRESLIAGVSIPRAQDVDGTPIDTYVKYFSGMFNGADCKLVFSNDSPLGESDGFNIYFRIRALK